MEQKAMFASLRIDASKARRQIGEARAEFRRFVADMAKQGVTVNPAHGELIFKVLRQIYDERSVAEAMKPYCFSVIEASRKAPVPFDTGALSKSGFVENGPRAGHVNFGFNQFYGFWQDVGTVNLPPKPYGSKKGPNFYFTETLRRRKLDAYKAVVAHIQDQLQFAASRLGT
jgi:hypothetical protein